MGIVGYSYAVADRYPDPARPGFYIDNKGSPTTMRAALTNDATAEIYDPGGNPVFPNAVVTPTMPWKTNTIKGHVMGILREPRTNGRFNRTDGTRASIKEDRCRAEDHRDSGTGNAGLKIAAFWESPARAHATSFSKR